MKYFIVADVHSFYTKMIDALDKAGYDKTNPDHCFVSCGDLLDRGNEAVACLNFVNALPASNKILIKGNHEYLMDRMLHNHFFGYHDWSNGTVGTVGQVLYTLTNEDEDCTRMLHNEKWTTYWNSLVDYAEIDDFIVVHGWIPTEDKSGMALSPSEWNNNYASWAKASWLNCYKYWLKGHIPYNKTIICGHWGTYEANTTYHNNSGYQAFVDEGIIALDGTAALHEGRVNCVVIEDNKVIYVSDER